MQPSSPHQLVHDLLQENQRLRFRVESLEEGSGKFATPEAEDKARKTKTKVKEAKKGKIKEAARPPSKEAARSPSKEAARPPSKEAAIDPEAARHQEAVSQEAARPPQDQGIPNGEGGSGRNLPNQGEGHGQDKSKPIQDPVQESQSQRVSQPNPGDPPSSSSSEASSSTSSSAEESVEQRRRKKRSSRTKDKERTTTLGIMMQLVQGMQSLQKQVLEGKDEEREGRNEYVRGTPVLPMLPEWSPATGPIDMNDWMALIDPIMSDLTDTSGEWWSLLVQEATQWYHEHLQLQPLERMAHQAVPSSSLAKDRWKRLEKRASTLLLMAVPEGQREELAASKRLSSLSILCQLMVSYKPGGLAEKELILRSLESPGESSNLQEAVQALRRWSRWRRRAAELKISEPDPYLLLKGLNKIIRKPLENNRELNFRISLARSMLQVDSTPTASSVTSFAQHLLAEFEQIVHQETSSTTCKAEESRRRRSKEDRRRKERRGWEAKVQVLPL